MRELLRGEVAVQIWSKDDATGVSQKELVEKIIRRIESEKLGNVTEVEGPTAHLPDFFSELYGTMSGFLIYIQGADPGKLKEISMELEEVNGERVADIDIYLDYFKKISRK